MRKCFWYHLSSQNTSISEITLDAYVSLVIQFVTIQPTGKKLHTKRPFQSMKLSLKYLFLDSSDLNNSLKILFEKNVIPKVIAKTVTKKLRKRSYTDFRIFGLYLGVKEKMK
jgi:hypothetical protein